jgi:hypothetical protein
LKLNPNYQKAQQRLSALNQKLGVPVSNSAPNTELYRLGATDNRVPLSAPVQAPPPSYAPPQPQVSVPAYTPAPGYSSAAPSTGGLNWGAALLPFCWSIAHKAWLWMGICLVLFLVKGVVHASPLISGICIVCGLGVRVWLLVQGNKIGQQNRSFDGDDQFREVQRKWTIWGIVVDAIGVIFYAIAMLLFAALLGPLLGGLMMGGKHLNVNPSMSPSMSMPGFSTGSTSGQPVKPGFVDEYPGATQQGQWDMTTSATIKKYTASASIDKVAEYYVGVGKKCGDSPSAGSGSTRDFDLHPMMGDTQVHLESKGADQTDIKITEHPGK